jgi:phosphate transport system protein
MTRTLLDKELQALDAQIMRLGALVGQALAKALEALETSNQDESGAVIVADMVIDDLRTAIEEHALRVLILQQPLGGRDLRYLTSLLSITIDLERIGDEAEGIAQNVLRMMPFRSDSMQSTQDQRTSFASGGGDHHSTEIAALQRMLNLGQEVRYLLQQTMTAFANRDAQTARSLWEKDPVVRQQSYSVRQDLMTLLEGAHAIPAVRDDPHMLQRATYLLWIALKLERAADHCANICERIVFIVEGEMEMQPPLD